MDPAYAALVARVRRARRSSDQVLLEGAHALKHAIRFGADIEVALTPDRAALTSLLADLAPDIVLPGHTVEVDAATWREATGARELPSPSLAAAPRPAITAQQVLATNGRVIVLEQPRHLGNLGAVIRVAAAAGAAGVLVVGDADPWHPTAVRAAAGLQFALPVARADALPETDRTLIAVDADGEPLQAPPGLTSTVRTDHEGTPSPKREPVDDPAADGDRADIPADAVLLLGTERAGLSAELRARANRRVAIPMRPGVSSLNLATAAAVVLFAP